MLSDFLEIIEGCQGKNSIIFTSQLPVSQWHDIIREKKHRRCHYEQACSLRSPFFITRRINEKKKREFNKRCFNQKSNIFDIK